MALKLKLPKNFLGAPSAAAVARMVNQLERLLRDAFAAALGPAADAGAIGADDDFFADLGGDSMRVMRLRYTLRRLGHDVSVPDLQRHATVAALATHLAVSPALDPTKNSDTRTAQTLLCACVILHVHCTR